jgi:hypothetical protein
MGLKITLQQAAVRLRRIPRKESNRFKIRSLTPQQAAGNALAIAGQVYLDLAEIPFAG